MKGSRNITAKQEQQGIKDMAIWCEKKASGTLCMVGRDILQNRSALALQLFDFRYGGLKLI